LTDPLASPESQTPYIYARVSGTHQVQEGNLARQVNHLKTIVSQIWGSDQKIQIIQECGSGLNPDRPGIQRLITAVQKGKVARVYVTYRDRLTRFGYTFLESWFREHHVTIQEVDHHHDEDGPESQLTTDIMALLASFSGKLYKQRALIAHGKKGASPAMDKETRLIQQIIARENYSSLQAAIKRG
jgi:predicted site-specific integrase-resolvase